MRRRPRNAHIAFALEKAFSIYGAAIVPCWRLYFCAVGAQHNAEKAFEFFRADPAEKPEKKTNSAAAIAEPAPEQDVQQEAEKTKKPVAAR